MSRHQREEGKEEITEFNRLCTNKERERFLGAARQDWTGRIVSAFKIMQESLDLLMKMLSEFVQWCNESYM